MKRGFADIATTIDQFSGRPLTFGVALLIIAAWALSGPLFNFSDTWQLHYQYGHNRHYISDGLRYSEHAKPGWSSHTGEA
jgi:hypothetical protein